MKVKLEMLREIHSLSVAPAHQNNKNHVEHVPRSL